MFSGVLIRLKLFSICTAIVLISAPLATAHDSKPQIIGPVKQAISEAWYTIDESETILGMIQLNSRSDSSLSLPYSPELIESARLSKDKLSRTLVTLDKMERFAGDIQIKQIEILRKRTNSQTTAIDVVLAAYSDDGELEAIDFCTNWVACVGFRTACEGADGTWRDEGGGFPFGVESCTTKEVGPN